MHSVDVPKIDTSSVLSFVAQEAARATGASGVAIAIGNAKAMCCCASVGEAPPVGVLAGPDSGLSGLCMRTSELVQCDDTATDSRVDPSAGQRLRSVLIVPILSGGRLQGMLQAVSSRPHAFNNEQRELLCRMAERIATVLGDSALENIPPQAPQSSATKASAAPKPNIAVLTRAAPQSSPETRANHVTAPAEEFTPPSHLEERASQGDGQQKAGLAPVMRAGIIAAVAAIVIVGGYELTHLGGTPSQAATPATANNAAPPSTALPNVAIEQSSLAVALEQPPAGHTAAQLTPGKLLKKVDPVYPPSARSGAVVLNAVVNRDGRVADVRVVRGPEDLAGPAIDAVRQWVFEPYRIGSTPVEAESTITVKVTPRK